MPFVAANFYLEKATILQSLVLNQSYKLFENPPELGSHCSGRLIKFFSVIVPLFRTVMTVLPTVEFGV